MSGGPFVVCCECHRVYGDEAYFWEVCPECGCDWIFMVDDKADAEERIAEYDAVMVKAKADWESRPGV